MSDTITMTDPLSVAPVAEVELFDGDRSLGMVTDLGNGRWSKSVPVSNNHTYNFQARTQEIRSNNWAVTVKGIAPHILRVDSDGVELAENELNEADQVTFHGTAAPYTVITLLGDGASYGTANASGSGEWSKAVAGLLTGTHIFTARDGSMISNEWRVRVKPRLNDFVDFANNNWGGWAKGPAGQDIIWQSNDGGRLFNATYGPWGQQGIALIKSHSGLKVGGEYRFSITAAQIISPSPLARLELATSAGVVVPGFYPPSGWTLYSGLFTAIAKVMEFRVNSLVGALEGNDYLINDLRIERMR